MQVFSSYFLCVKLVILCAQNVIPSEGLDTTTVTTQTISLTNNANDLENNTIVLPTTIAIETDNSTIFPSTTSESLITTDSTTIFSITTENFINGLTTSTRGYSDTTTESTFSESTITETPITSSTIEIITSTTQIDKTTTTEQPGTNSENTTTVLPTTVALKTNSFAVFGGITTVQPTDSTTTSLENFLSTTTTGNITTTYIRTTTETPCTILDSINVTVTDTFKTEANISIVAVSNATICPTQIDIYCNATAEHNNLTWWWVIGSQFYTFEINSTNLNSTDLNNTDLNNTNLYYFMLGNFSEFTNYTCELATDNSPMVNFSVHTKPAVPSSPVHLNITSVTASSFAVTWEEPDKIPTILNGYEVTIIRRDVASDGHFWSNCSKNYTYTRTLTENTLWFGEALADFVYEVFVKALSDAGDSDATNNTTSTLAAASDPPENVTFDPTEIEGNRYIDMIQHVTWSMPCNTNGPVRYFQVELVGYYQYNDSRADTRSAQVAIFHNQSIYSYTFSDLWAASNYTFSIYLVGNETGKIRNDVFLTNDNYPSAPDLYTPVTSPHHFTVVWKEPSNNPGNITNYTVNVQGKGLSWTKTKYCNISDYTYNDTENVQVTKYSTSRVVPDAHYVISVSAVTSRGQGNATYMIIQSNATHPDSLAVSNHIYSHSDTEYYNDTVKLHFASGCFNGQFESYVVRFTGTRAGYEDHSGNKTITHDYVEEYSFGLQPEYNYTVNVTVNNEQYSTVNWTNFIAPAGVPTINTSVLSSIPITPASTEISLTLKRSFFDEKRGTLKYLAIIISDENVTGGTFNQWVDSSHWPVPSRNSGIYYQATPTYWKAFNKSDTIEYVIGNDTSCIGELYCNKPLEPAKQYYIFVRLFNDNFYRNSMAIPFVTEKASRLALILGSIAALLFVAIQGFVVFILWKKGIISFKHDESHGYREVHQESSDALISNSGDFNRPMFHKRRQTEPPKTEIPKKKFVAYSKYLEDNPQILTAQWNELENQSKIVYDELPHHFATLSENKRKNRFTNILPFDHSRVKINIDEDDEICSDYINASYIKGFSGANEYIATQGPLADTCRDFWKMVLQERVSIIVMVSRFIENNRDKCYKYFPNNRETMTIGDDIEVRCSIELHFGFYCIRTLQVKKELQQVTVTHMQFLEWPDFGVPNGTESMLNFCHQFRERWTSEGGMAVVHCSAGVGRTGTLLATDILIRALAAGRKIDVFNTVLELRKQRKSMVQTEKQYMYIYQLIASMIEFPIVDEQDNPEHLYENIDNRNRNGIVESAL